MLGLVHIVMVQKCHVVTCPNHVGTCLFLMVQKFHFISCCDLSESCLYLSESYGVVGIKDGSATSAPHSVSSCLASSAIVET